MEREELREIQGIPREKGISKANKKKAEKMLCFGTLQEYCVIRIK